MSDAGKNRRRRAAWVFVAIAVLVVILWGAAKGRNRSLVEARLPAATAGLATTSVGQGDVHEYVSCTGSLMPIRMQVLASDASGKVTRVYVEEGARVALGATLCEVQSSSAFDFSAQSDKTVLTAPFDGVVSSVAVQAGGYVGAGQPAVTVMDMSSYVVNVEIDEIDLARVEPGMAADVSFDAIPDVELPGKVESMGVAAMPRAGMVVIPIRVSIRGSHDMLKPGLTTNVRILSRSIPNVVRIPVRSWIDMDGQPSAIRIAGGAPELVPVELGLSDGNYTHVLSGLSPGDEIVEDAVAAQERLRRLTGQDRDMQFRIRHAD
ncbi:MAG TPA: efflux RND transporter periplasmic adaptor subunit [Bacillota bacterium]|nr:HlyD family efflux transporter periplasmic adaptor subunit [Bacillota bacterium]HNY68181.1 efflux RND transporter periplasmic adaptor subunit [Bacillota bacterium]HOI38593.1 efflux RND transporter periplasmic adaptor subunit [Bacillota bacterium]